MMLRCLLALIALACAGHAHAHKPSDSYLALDVKGQQVTGRWDIALRDLDYAIGLDADGDGQLTWDEIRRQHAAIATYALARLDLSLARGPCAIVPGEQQVERHTDGAYTVLRFSATCPASIAALTVGYRLFADTDPQHKGLLRIEHGDATSTAILDPAQARQTVLPQAPDRLRQLGDYIGHGAWHIWIGFDHILFLLSLLLPAVLLQPGHGIRVASIDVLKVVTAFTLAHSLTLTLASLEVVALPSRWVESAIAASVALAALNNIVPLLRGHRPAFAFGFGLLHGFGFAGVLAGLGLGQGSRLLSLAGFNLGVELGQLAIVAGFLPLAFLLRRTGFYRHLVRGGSGAIAAVGALWFVQRALDM